MSDTPRTFEEWKKSYYIQHGFVSSTVELLETWQASRAALLAEKPDAAKFTFMLEFADAVLDPKVEIPVSHPSLIRDMRNAILSQQAQLAAKDAELAAAQAREAALLVDSPDVAWLLKTIWEKVIRSEASCKPADYEVVLLETAANTLLSQQAQLQAKDAELAAAREELLKKPAATGLERALITTLTTINVRLRTELAAAKAALAAAREEPK